MTLLEQLTDYCTGDALPMHMPGHKRNTAPAGYLDALGAGLDITEIDGFSDLHDPEGALAERMRDAAALWGSRRAWWLIGGSTAGLLSGIFAAAAPGDTVLLARNCHKSVYNAVMLRGLTPRYLSPAPWPGKSFSGPVTPEAVEAAFAAHPQAKLLVLTSPTYEGVISDIPFISDIAHRHGAAVLVDEAHGAHLGLSPAFGPGAVTAGADLVVQSLHKTLPSLTQTGLLHLCPGRISPDAVGYWLSVFQTSSPSYLLMASIDGCVDLLRRRGPELLDNWSRAIDGFYEQAAGLRHLALPLAGRPGTDKSKLVISTARAGITGPELARRLREEHHIETEMAAPDYLIAMTGMGDTPVTLSRFARALLAVDGTLRAGQAAPLPTLPVPEAVLPMGAAMESPVRLCPITDAAGEIAADFLWAYPPGIPLVTPGEVIPAALPAYAAACDAAGVTLRVPRQTPDGMLRVVKRG